MATFKGFGNFLTQNSFNWKGLVVDHELETEHFYTFKTVIFAEYLYNTMFRFELSNSHHICVSSEEVHSVPFLALS